MSLVTSSDVIIAGYGPVGQAMAIELVQLGHRVTVIERWNGLYNLPRAVGYDYEVARILQGLGVSKAMAPHVAAVKTYEWRNAEGEVLLAFENEDRIAMSGWRAGNAFSQPDLEAALDARLRGFGDRVQILQGWEVVGLETGGDLVTIEARCKEAPGISARRFAAPYVIGCDGAGSFVRQAMDGEYEDLGFSADWLVVDIRPKDPALWNSDLAQICDPARPTTLVCSGPGRRRAEFMLLPGETKEAMNNAEAAWRLLAPHGWGPHNAALERHAVYSFRGCIARQWRRGRLLLAGDAAHLTPPFAAQGLCAGMRDVQALAWRLDLVLRGIATPGLLDSYQAERQPHVRRFIEFAISLGKVICVLDPIRARARDAGMRAGLKPPGLAGFPSSFVADSAMVRPHDPHAGTPSLQARVRRHGDEGLFDDLAGGGFVLLSLRADPLAACTSAQRSFMRRLGIKTVTIGSAGEIEDVNGDYARWFAHLRCDTVLIRPDFYLYGAGSAEDLMKDFCGAGVWQ